jgi:crotonobetainyl-CoA:carnitine CoA-transferase CaiB-like acyl-CoA transferase
MTRALQGISVVALEQAVAAPLASSRLADAGARVVKLERSGQSSAHRTIPTINARDLARDRQVGSLCIFPTSAHTAAQRRARST